MKLQFGGELCDNDVINYVEEKWTQSFKITKKCSNVAFLENIVVIAAENFLLPCVPCVYVSCYKLSKVFIHMCD